MADGGLTRRSVVYAVPFFTGDGESFQRRGRALPGVNIIGACGVAFVAVFVLLSFLAAIIQGITNVFPQRKSVGDLAMLAAVSSVVSTLYPGARVTRIEEE